MGGAKIDFEMLKTSNDLGRTNEYQQSAEKMFLLSGTQTPLIMKSPCNNLIQKIIIICRSWWLLILNLSFALEGVE